MGHLPKLWCRRYLLDDKTAPPANPKADEKYIKIKYDAPHDIWTVEGRLGAGCIVLAAFEHATELQQFGLEASAASMAMAA